MEKDLEKFSTTSLRSLFIEETKVFILLLEHGSTSAISENRHYLKQIFDLITERERKEQAILHWGKNTSKLEQDESRPNSEAKEK